MGIEDRWCCTKCVRVRCWHDLYVAMNRLDAAAAEVARCRQIMAAGEDWRGRAGDVALADAVVAAARGNYDFADRQFEAAVSIHRKFHVAWEEADTLIAGDSRSRPPAIPPGGREVRRRDRNVPRSRRWPPLYRLDNGRQDARASSAPAQTDFGAAQHPNRPKHRRPGLSEEKASSGPSATSDTFRLKDAKGLHYVVYLLARPGQAHPCP